MPLGGFRVNSLAKYAPPTSTAVTITAYGNAKISTAQSKFGGASALFDGTGDYLDLNENIMPVGAFTIEMWYRPSSLASVQTLWSNFLNNEDGSATLWVNTTGQVNFYLKPSSIVSSTTNLVVNTWYHIAVRKNSSDGYALYINGVSEATATNSTAFSSTKNLIGARFNNSLDSFAEFTNGYIDELRISNTARYTDNFTPSTSAFINDANTLLLMHMDGTNNSTVFVDDNGQGRSAVGLSAFGNAQIDTAQSKFGGSGGYFDGNGDYVIAANNTLLYWNAGTYTLEFWARAEAFESQQFDDPLIVGNTNPAGQQDYWSFGPDNSGNLTFKYYNGNSVEIRDSGTMSTGVWHHCAVTHSSGTIKTYLDGTLKNTATVSGTPQFETSYGGLNIGWGNGTTSAYQGWIDELRISNTVRYTDNFTPSTSAFVNDANTLLLMHMDGADGSTEFVDDNS
jgi:hypothetical protein